MTFLKNHKNLNGQLSRAISSSHPFAHAINEKEMILKMESEKGGPSLN